MKKLLLNSLILIFLTSVLFGQGSWQASTSISPTSSYRGATATYSEDDQHYLFVFGGWTTSSGNFNETSIYNFSDDTWTEGVAIPENTRGGSAVCINDDIYLLCGNDGVDNDLNSQAFLKYNITSETWEYMAEYPIAARYVAMAYNYSNGLIYCAGGSGDYYEAVDAVNAYDPSTNTWNPCTSLKYLSSGGSAMAYQGNHLYMVGGIINQPYDKLNIGLVSFTDPYNISWSNGMSIPVEMAKVSAAYFGNGEIIATDLNGTFVYDISSDIWSMISDKPILVKGGNYSSVEMDGVLTFAVAGGKSVDEIIVDHIEYISGEENNKFPVTFVVNFFSGGAVANAEIEVASTILYTDESGSAVMYLEDGNYDYTATFNDLISYGSFTIDGEGVYIDVQLPVSVDEHALNFSFYPNPSKGILYINTSDPIFNNSLLNVDVFDLNGKSIDHAVVNSSGTKQLDLSHLNKGVYFIAISNSNKNGMIKKLILK